MFPTRRTWSVSRMPFVEYQWQRFWTMLAICTYSCVFHYCSISTVKVNWIVMNVLTDVDSCTNVLCCYYHEHRNQLTNHNEKFILHSVISGTFIDIFPFLQRVHINPVVNHRVKRTVTPTYLILPQFDRLSITIDSHAG